MKDELIYGIKYSIERGFTMEEAIASFVNAGYNPGEVDEAAKIVSGASPLPQIRMREAQPVPSASEGVSGALVQQGVSGAPAPQSSPEIVDQSQKAGQGMVITIIILLIVVLASLGYVVYKYFLN